MTRAYEEDDQENIVRSPLLIHRPSLTHGNQVWTLSLSIAQLHFRQTSNTSSPCCIVSQARKVVVHENNAGRVTENMNTLFKSEGFENRMPISPPFHRPQANVRSPAPNPMRAPPSPTNDIFAHTEPHRHTEDIFREMKWGGW